MSAEDVLIQVRKDKHQELNGGVYPIPTNEKVHYMDCSTAKELAAGSPVSLVPAELGTPQHFSGRISLLRKSGGITFIKLTDNSGSVQVIGSKAVLPDYDRLKLLDLGDIIEFVGQLCMSKTGEPSVLINSWNLLTKAHRPPPEKFAGIADQELKYRKRYLDLMSDEETRNRFKVRSAIIRGIRDFMEQKDFMEVETSTLNALKSGATAKPFVTHHNALDMDLYLRIAPELYLKRLLVGGFDRVFEIGRNYRNEGISTRHNPEFTMMESYQAYGKFPDLIVYTKALLRSVQDYCESSLTGSALEYFKNCRELRPFSLSQFVEVPMWTAVVQAAAKAEIILSGNLLPALQVSYNDMPQRPDMEITNLQNERLQKIDIKGLFHALQEAPTRGHKIAILFEFLAEPFLTTDYRSGDNLHSAPVFITQFPKDICPLARSCDTNPSLCDRFELYIEGRELANAFQELNDPIEQAERFEEQLDESDDEAMDFDHDYVEALEHGMPPAIGFGMGIDRLVMLFTNSQSIKDVILFPTLKTVK